MLKGIELPHSRKEGHRDHRSLGLRQVDLHPLPEPHARGRSRRSGRGPGAARAQDIYAQGVDPVRVRRRVGMVFQKPNPFPTMSIRDNVLAGLEAERRKRASDPDALVEKALRQAALWDEVKDALTRSGTSLSGGQQQRLCIARCLALEPEVF